MALHDWQDYVGKQFGWAPWEIPGIIAASARAASDEHDPYKQLCSMGKVLRVRDCLDYIQQTAHLRDGEWFNYLTIRLTDRILVPGDKDAHLFKARDLADTFFGMAAICTGEQWDLWLEEYNGSREESVARKAVAQEFARVAWEEGRITREALASFSAECSRRIVIDPTFVD